MNARTGELALDVAFEHFTGQPPVALIFGYNGAARPTKAEVVAWNRPFVMGFESSTTRAYAGGDAGDADATFTADVFDAWGYPKDCGYWYCAADSPSTPPQFLPNVRAYGYRFVARMRARGYLAPADDYGNRDAVEAAAAGTRDAGSDAIRWGVGTWTGYGESGGGVPPNQCDVEVLQSGNNGGPMPATDLDWLYVPVARFSAFGGPATAPPPEEDDDMRRIVYLDRLDGGRGLMLVDGGRMLRDFGVAPAGTPFMVTDAYNKWRGESDDRGQLKIEKWDLEEWTAARDAAVVPVPAPAPGGGGTPIDVDELVAKLSGPLAKAVAADLEIVVSVKP